MSFINNKVYIFEKTILRKEISSWLYDKAWRKCLPIGFIRNAGT
jgi:hypothetical protein